MTMRIPKLLLFFGFAIVFGALAGRAQTTVIVQEGVSVSRALAGHADIGITKVPADGITVELCSPDSP